jgi:hypothetical protein
MEQHFLIWTLYMVPLKWLTNFIVVISTESDNIFDHLSAAIFMDKNV